LNEGLELLLKVESLTKRYCDTNILALDGVGFSMDGGEIIGILGESGAGKTTLLRILRGVETFDAGKITFEELEIDPASPKEAVLDYQRRTAIQLQRSFALWPDSAIDNVVRALRYLDMGEESIPDNEGDYRDYRDRALEILRVVGLEGRADLWSQVLSGGEKQRLIIARQIARRPRLLLLDEPGTMTDQSSKQEIVNALKRVKDTYGTGIVFASHNPWMHSTMADRTILLRGGKIIDDAAPGKVLNEFLAGLEPPLEKAGMPGPTILRMSKVTKKYELFGYGSVFELHETDLDFRRGEITGIIGPSSAGKTVILRMLAGLEMADSGNVELLHRGEWTALGQLGRKSLRARTRIGMLHQEFDLPHYARVLDLFAARIGIKDPRMMEEAIKRAAKAGIREDVVDALSRAAELPEGEMTTRLNEAGLDKELLKELFMSKDPEKARELSLIALKEMGLEPGLLERSVYELSGGEKIRLALALSLVFNPRVLILDEPFGDLDPITLRRVANALKRAKATFKPAIVLVSHQLDFVEEVADRCILIGGGKVITQGAPSEVIQMLKGHAEVGL
jgi:methyl coenzyme M reductase system subunit A2